MAQLKTIAAGVSFGVGLFFGLIGLLAAVQPDANQEERFGAIGVGVLGGVPPIVLGSWLLSQNRSQAQERERDRLRKIFFKQLHNGQGHINVLRFSMESNLSGADAKAFLDERAREFNAAYNVDQEGKISYFFDGDFSQPAIAPVAERYDIVIETPSRYRRQEMLQAIAELVSVPEVEAKRMLKTAKSHPFTLAYGIDKQTAEQFRRRLESAGVVVLVVLN
jgi:hypothetical protein